MQFTGGVVIVNNWVKVEDTTPPSRINDLRVLNAAADGNNVFTIGWTAPGDDLNLGQGKCLKLFFKFLLHIFTIEISAWLDETDH